MWKWLGNFIKGEGPILGFGVEERMIFYSVGCKGEDTILSGAKKLIAEIKRLREDIDRLKMIVEHFQ
jgi:hypothetical protein